MPPGPGPHPLVVHLHGGPVWAWRDEWSMHYPYTPLLVGRGYAVLRGDGAVVTTKAAAEAATSLEVEFQDGRLGLSGRPRKGKAGPEGQGSLFD